MPQFYNNCDVPIAVATTAELLGTPISFPTGTPIFNQQTASVWYWFDPAVAPATNGTTIRASTWRPAGFGQTAIGGAWVDSGIGGAGVVALSFATIATGAVGSGRLIDISATQLAALRVGQWAWIQSVKDYFRWDPLSTLAPDAGSITICNPTANGANPGRFIRVLLPAPEWAVLYSTVGNGTIGCVVDGSNSTGTSSDENDGMSLATALLTDDERGRRMGPAENWTQLEYHIRYVSDVDHVLLLGTLQDSELFLHGSMTDGQGQAVLYTGTIDALTAQNPATNVPYQVTSNALPVSWTASALITTGLANTRVRLTSNTVGATCYPVLDLGAKQARFSDAMPASTYTRAAWAVGFANAVLVNGSTFVVEKLTQIKYFHCELRSSRGVFDTLGSGGAVIAESLYVGARDGVIGSAEFNSSCVYTFDACRLINSTSTRSLGGANMVWRSTWLSGTAVSARYAVPRFAAFTGISGGCDVRFEWNGVDTFGGFGAATLRNNWFFQNGQLTVLNSGQIGVFAVACFDPPVAVQEAVFVTVGSLVLFAANATFWGGGAVNPVLFVWFVQNRGVVMYSNLANISLRGTTQDIRFSTGPNVPAFDAATSIFTAPRATSFANLVATVAAGGFGGFISDPLGGGQVTTN